MNRTTDRPLDSSSAHTGPLVASATLLGMGMGGFIDGIVLHQILQWHNMLSTPLPPIDLVNVKVNMLWDGLFHAFTWMLTMAGLVLFWRASKRVDVAWSTPIFAGSLVLGWGVFNLVEGVLSHQLLNLHHVRPGADQLTWDLGFLIFGAALVAAGSAAIRSGRARPLGAHSPMRWRQKARA
jgi:uncharacterized membrane protein